MDYGRIISRSFEIAWKYKWLWLFGMFAAGTGFNLKFEYVLGLSPTNPFSSAGMENIDPKTILATYAGLMPIAFLMGLMALFSTASIIDTVNRIERGGSYSFGSAFSAGVDNFFLMFGLALIFFVSAIAYMIFLVLLIILLSAINKILGGLAGFFLVIASMFLGLLVVQILNLSYRVVVMRKCGLFDAISEATKLVKMNIGKNVAAFFIMLVFGIGFAIITGIFWVILNFPIDAIIQAMNLHSYLAMMAALVIGLPISFIFAGIFGVFGTTFMTLFYIELVEPMAEKISTQPPPEINFNR